MNISFVLAVYNNLHLTKECYRRVRLIYPDTPFIISSGGSNDGTKEWLESLNDEHLISIHSDTKLTFSENFNTGIKLVNTEKLVLIHNDMVIGKGFLENLENHLTPNRILSYTTIEPPIFPGHDRPGKLIKDWGNNFEEFKEKEFNEFVEQNKNNCQIYDGATFFMSGYKESFMDIGLFDEFSFIPCFCEDDDFLIRTKLKGYELHTIDCALTYHFVSLTSRFSDEFRAKRFDYEINSNRNFIRKWGISIAFFHEMRYWEHPNLELKKFSMGISLNNLQSLHLLEPFFDKVKINTDYQSYLNSEQLNTRYDLSQKFIDFNAVDVIVSEKKKLTIDDIEMLSKLRLMIPHYEPGIYEIGNLSIKILNKV